MIANEYTASLGEDVREQLTTVQPGEYTKNHWSASKWWILWYVNSISKNIRLGISQARHKGGERPNFKSPNIATRGEDSFYRLQEPGQVVHSEVAEDQQCVLRWSEDSGWEGSGQSSMWMRKSSGQTHLLYSQAVHAVPLHILKSYPNLHRCWKQQDPRSA